MDLKKTRHWKIIHWSTICVLSSTPDVQKGYCNNKIVSLKFLVNHLVNEYGKDECRQDKNSLSDSNDDERRNF